MIENCLENNIVCLVVILILLADLLYLASHSVPLSQVITSASLFYFIYHPHAAHCLQYLLEKCNLGWCVI